MSGYYINGYGQIGECGRRFLAQSVVCSLVPDPVLKEVLRGSRVAKAAPALKETVHAEIAALSSIPIEVWQVLGAVAGVNGQEISAVCVRVSHRSVAFFHFRVLDEAEKLP